MRIGGRLNAWKGANIDQKNNLVKKESYLKFSPTLLRHNGIPEAADALAYEPVQRLLAVATSDGRVKVFGQYGLEIAFDSLTQGTTRSLYFLPNAGALLRLPENGPLELLNLDDRKISTVLEFNDDQISCYSLIPGTPYIMLGCSSGILRVCAMTDSNSEPISLARPIRNIRLLNYRVSKHLLKAAGEMSCLTICLSSAGPLALMLHSISGVLIWNIRRSKAVCHLPQDSMEMMVSAKMPDPGLVTTVCWIGKLTLPYLFATGHNSGDILTWYIPDNLQGIDHHQQMQFPQPMQHFTVREGNCLGSKILSLAFVSGDVDGVLVYGGQAQEEPAGLNLLKFQSFDEEQDDSERTSMPWFGSILGFALVPPKGSMEDFEDPVGIIVLTEFGNLILHDIKQDSTVPFSMPFQICHQHANTTLFTTLSSLSPLQSLSSNLMLEIGGILDLDYLWVVAGGIKENKTTDGAASNALVIGYCDGSVRFWDISSSAPLCFLYLESSDLFHSVSISDLVLLDDGKLLIIGDEKGQIFIFHFSLISRIVELRSYSLESQSFEVTSSEQPAGYQLIVRMKLHEASIQKLLFHSSSSVLAALDEHGMISLLNFVTLEPILVSSLKHEHPIIDITFCEVMESVPEASVSVLLFLSDKESGLLAIDTASGQPLSDSEWFRPRNTSRALAIYTLTENGAPVEQQTVELPHSEAFLWTIGKDIKIQKTDSEKEENGEGGEEEQVQGQNTDSERKRHARFVSDDIETGALLAAAVAKLAEERDSKTSVNMNYRILLITDCYVRLYSPQSILALVRAPLHKIQLSSPILWSTVFSSQTSEESNGTEGGLILLTKDAMLHLIALPSLETVGSVLLRGVINFPINEHEERGEIFLTKPHLIESDGSGGVYIGSQNGELVHLEVVPRSESEQSSMLRFSLYDWELATAAYSAAHVQISQIESVHDETLNSPMTIKRGMNFFVSLGRRAKDELDKAMRLPGTTQASQETVPTVSEPPELEVLFCVGERGPSAELRSKTQVPLDTHYQEPVKVTGTLGKIRSPEAMDKLTYTPASPLPRTPEEVRAKYGRSKTSYQKSDDVNDLGGIMSENISKLHERGERLKNLNDKTEDLVNDAQNFAEMAKQLAQQKNKKWWQL